MSGLYLNYCFVDVSKNESNVYVSDYSNEIDIRELRIKHPQYCFYRNGKKLYYWSDTNSFPINYLNSKEEVISPALEPAIISKMLEYKLLSLFDKNIYDVYFKKYTHSFVAKKKEPVYTMEALNLYESIEISTYFFIDNDKLYFGFNVSFKLEHSFSWSKMEFKQNSIDNSGLFENKAGKVCANKIAIKRYIETKGIVEEYNNQIKTLNSKQSQFTYIDKVIKYLSNNIANKSLYKDIMIESCDINHLPYTNKLQTEQITPPVKYYGNNNTAPSRMFPSEALDKFGTYQSVGNSIIKISIVSIEEYKGSINEFTQKLSEKIKKIFKLNVQYSYYWLPSTSINDISKTIAPINIQNTDLALVITTKTQFGFQPQNSLYFYCKAKLIGQEVPTQYVCIETMRRSNDFILNNIALNIYAKNGGTAWGIEKIDTTKKELIIGIGSTVNSNGKNIVSIANVFENSGVYIAGTCDPVIRFSNYEKELEEMIKTLLVENLQGEKSVHLIFHIYKSASKKREIKALENVINSFTDVEISYAFVHLGYGHNFKIYNNDGISEIGFYNLDKSDLPKGQYIRISKHESLLVIHKDSTTPLKITIDKRSNFKDIYYISKQIFSFAHLSARSFTASKKPITIMYPSIMAGLIEKLKQVDNWDDNKLKVKGVTEKLWFL